MGLDLASAFHRGERVVCADGRRGIIEGWKGDRLLVYFGCDRGREARDWVAWTACTLEPEPVIQRGDKGTAQCVVVWPGTSG